MVLFPWFRFLVRRLFVVPQRLVCGIISQTQFMRLVYGVQIGLQVLVRGTVFVLQSPLDPLLDRGAQP